MVQGEAVVAVETFERWAALPLEERAAIAADGYRARAWVAALAQPGELLGWRTASPEWKLRFGTVTGLLRDAKGYRALVVDSENVVTTGDIERPRALWWLVPGDNVEVRRRGRARGAWSWTPATIASREGSQWPTYRLVGIPRRRGDPMWSASELRLPA